jgi:DNA-binding transcriptional MerR regulator
MSDEQRRLNPEEAAEATSMDVHVVWRYAELGLITPSSEGYTENDLAELRRVRRLREHLELDHPAIEIVVRMCRRIQALQDQIRHLQRELRTARGTRDQPDWVEAEWNDLFDEQGATQRSQ